MYLNTSQRGYPKGLRAGSDPRKPVVSVDEHFEKIDCRGISSALLSIEVNLCILCPRTLNLGDTFNPLIVETVNHIYNHRRIANAYCHAPLTGTGTFRNGFCSS